MKRLLTVLLLLATTAMAQTSRGIKVFQGLDEGSAIYTRGGGLVQVDCIGSGIVCASSGQKMTITISSFAGGTITSPILAADGSRAAHRHTRSAVRHGTGIWRGGAQDLRFDLAGTDVLKLISTGLINRRRNTLMGIRRRKHP
jgi:hypothetical protein